MTRLCMAGRTDPGRQRARNEDAIAWDEQQGFAVLADGMGGHNAGHVASNIALDMVTVGLAILDSGRLAEGLGETIHQANHSIREAAEHCPDYAGMGTTLVVVLCQDDRLIVAHVGDSRLYRLRRGTMEQLTVDHSLVQELVDSGYLSPEDARHSTNRNVITRALGTDPEVEVALGEYELLPNDLLLLCSDGLSDLVEDRVIQAILEQPSAGLADTADQLIAEANEQGGTDNISVILIQC